MTTTTRNIALAGIITALASTPLFIRVPNPYNSILLDQLHNCGHSLLFFAFHLLSLLIARQVLVHRYALTSLPLTIAMTSGFSFVAGAAIELIQPYVGREASWGDIGRNCLGIIAANGAFLTIAPDVRSILAKAAGAFIAIAALVLSLLPAVPWAYAQLLREQAFPVLADYENAYLNRYIFAASGGEVGIIEAPPQWSTNSGHVARVVFPQGKTHPGMLLRNPSMNWQGYSALVFDVYSPSPLTEVMAVNIYSAEKSRRPLIHRSFAIDPGLHSYRIHLPGQAILKQHHITDVIWHALNADHTTVIYLDNIRLE